MRSALPFPSVHLTPESSVKSEQRVGQGARQKGRRRPDRNGPREREGTGWRGQRRPRLVSNFFLQYLSHRIFRHMYKILNIIKK